MRFKRIFHLGKCYDEYLYQQLIKLDIEKFRLDTGIESVTEANYEFMENMMYTGRLRLFSRFNSLDVWDVNWDNIVTAKINDYFNVNFNFNYIYQLDQSVKSQYKENLSLGFSYVIF